MKRVLKNRSGASIAIVAVCIALLVGCAAIAIDIGMLLDSRAEAQRAADAGALAGASALLQLRDRPSSEKQAEATTRAVALATANEVRNAATAAGDVAVEFLNNDTRIAVTVRRGGIPPLFAGIFGVNSLQVAATAHAMWYQGGSASCLKPFGVPDTEPFTLGSVGNEILIWEKDQHNLYPLVKHLIKDEGGNNVRDAIQSEICNNTLVTVGERLELQSGTAPFTGQVEQGLRTLYNRDTELDYNPGLYGDTYEGFNRPDWRSSSRVINLVTYDPTTTTQTTFAVTGFLSVFLSGPLVNAAGGNRLQYGVVLPHRAAGGSGPCTPPNCSALSFNFRLVQ